MPPEDTTIAPSVMDKGQYLDSWKEISAYLKRTLRTCQTWERELGLPVHRLDDSPKARVFAYTGELDAWRDRMGKLPENEENGSEGVGRRRKPPRPLFVAAAVAGPILAAIATWFFISQFRASPTPAVGRFIIKVEPGFRLESGRWTTGGEGLRRLSRLALTISRDGSFIVYSAVEEDPAALAKPRLFLRKIDRPVAEPIAGTEGGTGPFLSPDGRWVGFTTDGKLKKVAVTGGVPVTLCDLSAWLFGASWGPGGAVVFSDGVSAGLSMVAAQGGKPEVLTVPDQKAGEYAHRLPFWLPGGDAVLFTSMRQQFDERPSTSLLRMDTRERRVLLEDASDARYVPTGHLLFMRQGTLMAVRFDPAGLEVVGQPVALIENVMQAFSSDSWHNSAAGQFSVSDSGSIIFVAGGVLPAGNNSLVWVDGRGRERPISEVDFPYFAPRLSPDGRKIAHTSLGSDGKVWVFDLETGTDTPLTSEGSASFAIWTQDGRRLVFDWHVFGKINLYWQAADGSSPMERLTESDHDQFVGSLAADGVTVAFVEYRSDKNCDIKVVDTSTGRVTPFLDSPADELYPDLSPDGRWMAYQSNESGRYEVYISAFPGPGQKIRVSTDGGSEPLWARDGRELFYRKEKEVWGAGVHEDQGLVAGKPRRLFELAGCNRGRPTRAYDLAPDGRMFLMTKRGVELPRPSPVTEIALIQNWFEELKRLVPFGKN